MPPWHIDKSLGIQEFQNDRSLSDAQIDTIVKWVDAGAPKGDTKDMPQPVEWPNDDVWNFEKMYGKPDLIIKSPAYTQKGNAQDAWYKPVIADRPDRSPLGARHRNAPRHREGPQDHPSRARPSAAERRRHRRVDCAPAATTPAPASSWNGPSASRAKSCARTRAS